MYSRLNVNSKTYKTEVASSCLAQTAGCTEGIPQGAAESV